MSKMLAGFCAGILVTGACAYWLWPRGAALAEDRRADTPVAKGPALPRRPADRERPARLESRSREDARASDPVVDSQAPSAVTNTSHTGNPGSSLEFPGGSLETQRSGDVDPLDKLLNSMRVYCLFDPGAGAFYNRCFKIQLSNDKGVNPDPYSTGAIFSVVAPRENAAGNDGEWNTFRVQVDGESVKVWINDRLVQETEAIDDQIPESGHIALDGIAGGIAYRRVVVSGEE